MKAGEAEENPMFKSIVVAYDGSAHAGRALQTAARLASQEQASLGIVYSIDADHVEISSELRKMGEIEHIIEPVPKMVMDLESAPPNLVNTMSQASAESEKAMLQYAEFLVGEARKSALEWGAEEVDTRVVLGDPAEVVVEYASEREADLIVCGSRGRGRLKSLLLGSTSHKINQLAACSCLTVR